MVYAFVVRRACAEASEQEIIDHCKQCIAGCKCSRQVSFVEVMPLPGPAKIRRLNWNRGVGGQYSPRFRSGGASAPRVFASVMSISNHL
jgi:hypothetical protein